MANRIRELREQRGWSSDHLATLVGVSGATIRRLELGDTKLTVDWMRTLSEALGCAPTDLLVLAAIAETEPEVVSYDGGPNAARTAVRRKGIEVYRVERSSLGAVGINPGDIVTVDESPEAISDVESGAVVLVDIEGALALRQYLRPGLIVTNRSGTNVALRLDDRSVRSRLVGVVILA